MGDGQNFVLEVYFFLFSFFFFSMMVLNLSHKLHEH